MRNHYHRRWAGLLLALLVGGCSRTAPGGAAGPDARAAAPGPARPRVVTTIYPLAAVTRELGGDAFEVVNLLPAGANAHTFELTPAAARSLEQARVVVRVGPGLDTWVEHLLPRGATVVTATAVTKQIQSPPDADEPGVKGGLAPDPHVWLDPVRMRDDIAPAITAALERVTPDRRADLEARLKTLQGKLTALDSELRTKLKGLKNPRYVASHSGWAYFNQRYGLVMVGVIEPVAGTDPSARWLKEVIELARREHAQAVFGEAQLNQQLGEAVAKEAGLQMRSLDPLGGDNVPGRDTYEGLLRFNADQFASGLAS